MFGNVTVIWPQEADVRNLFAIKVQDGLSVVFGEVANPTVADFLLARPYSVVTALPADELKDHVKMINLELKQWLVTL